MLSRQLSDSQKLRTIYRGTTVGHHCILIPLSAQKPNAKKANAPLRERPTSGNHNNPYRPSLQMPIKLTSPGTKLLE